VAVYKINNTTPHQGISRDVYPELRAAINAQSTQIGKCSILMRFFAMKDEEGERRRRNREWRLFNLGYVCFGLPHRRSYFQEPA
jgi:hypothetical protein